MRAISAQIYFFSVPIDAFLGLGIGRRSDFRTHPVRIEGSDGLRKYRRRSAVATDGRLICLYRSRG